MHINGFNELITKSVAEQRMVAMLRKYTREDLREIARQWGIRRGRNTVDTIKNLAESEHFPRMFGMVV